MPGNKRFDSFCCNCAMEFTPNSNLGKKRRSRNIISFKKESDTKKGQDGRLREKISTCIASAIKPLRILQFITVVFVFVLVIYTIAKYTGEISSLVCILLIVLSGIYVFILAIDLISQFSEAEFHVFPMFLVSLLGVILFGLSGVLLLVYSHSNFLGILGALVLCTILLALFFLIDVMIVLTFWKRRCDVCKQCCTASQPEVLFRRGDNCHPFCGETVRCDLMTSVSSLKVSPGDDDVMPDHSYRKVGYGRRRQYVDCPTSAQSVSIVDIAEIQTEPNAMSTVESQTQRTEIKDIPVQTLSRCELCHRQMHPYAAAPEAAPCVAQQQRQCTTCPAFVQLIRGVPCCPGCRCIAGIVQVQQQTQRQDQSQQLQPQQQMTEEQLQWIQAIESSPATGTLTSSKYQLGNESKVTAVPGTITKLTLASYCVKPNKRIQTSSQTAVDNDADVTKASKFVNRKDEKEEVKEVSDDVLDCKKRERIDTISIPEKNQTLDTTKINMERSPEPSIGRDAEMESGASSEMQVTEVMRKLRKIESSKLNAKRETDNEDAKEGSTEDDRKSTSRDVTLKIIDVAESDNDQTQIDSDVNNKIKKGESRKSSKDSDSSRRIWEVNNKQHVKKLSKKSAESKSSLKENSEDAKSATITTKTSKDNSLWSEDRAKSAHETTKSFREDSESLREISSTNDDKINAISETNGEHKSEEKERTENLNVAESTQVSILEQSVEYKEEDNAENAQTPQESTTTMKHEPSIHTVGTVSPSSNKSKRSRMLQRKNKVDPTFFMHATENQTLNLNQPTEIDAICINKPLSQVTANEQKEVSTEQKDADICPSCKQKKHLVTTSSSFQYYSVFTDKRGKLYCEFCATPNSIKVLNNTRGSDSKRLRCRGCSNFLRPKSIKNVESPLRNKTDVCRKCGQPQIHMAKL